jgi:uncharacterized membrane protein
MKLWISASAGLALCAVLAAHANSLFVDLGAADSRVAAGIFAQISATMLGFLIAALSILASISGSRLLRNLRKTGHYQVLLRCFFLDAFAFGASMLASFGALLSTQNFPWPYLISFGVFIFACLLLLDVAWKLWIVLNNLSVE